MASQDDTTLNMAPMIDRLPLLSQGKAGWPWRADDVALTAAAPEGKEWPKISLITPSYNQAEYLEETIRSVLLQGYPNLEYHVMDGGSKDRSVEIIRTYAPWLTSWESEADRGQSHAINKGFERATGDLIGWLNSDDLLLPNTLFRVAETFLTHPQVDVVHGAINYVDDRGGPLRVAQRREAEFRLDNALISSIYQPGTLWRRRLSERIGWLNEDLHYVMDYEYWMRMVLANAQFYSIPGSPLANFRVTDSSKTGKDQQMFGYENRALIAWFMAQDKLRKGGKPIPLSMRRQAMKARASANLTIAQSLSYSRDQRSAAGQWLIRAVCQYPPFLLIRRRQLREIVARLC